MRERSLTVRDKILVHLAPYSRYAEEFECPEAMSQAGISVAIGKSRAHTTLELSRMKEGALVSERLAHVSGTKSKRKTYILTAQALATESQITRYVEGLKVKLLDSGEFRTINGAQAAEAIMRELSTSRAMAFDIVLSSNGKIDLEEKKSQRVRTSTPLEGEIDSMDNLGAVAPESQTVDACILQANDLSKKGRPKEALAILENAMNSHFSKMDLSKLYYCKASIFRKQGNYPSALEEINKSLRIAEGSEKPLMIGRCQMEKAMILSGTGIELQSMQLLDSAEMIFRRESSQVDILRCGINQGMVLKNLGKTNEAIDVLEGALDLAEKTALDRLKAYAIVNLTDMLNEQKEYRRSRELSHVAMSIFRVLDEPIMLAASMFNRGVALAGLGEKEEAITNLDNAISILEKNEILSSRTNWLGKYASLLRELGEEEKAKSILGKI